MLDEEKIKLMTKITIYEKNEDTADLTMSRYYKEDYVKYHCLKTLVSVTLCYWLVFALYILINFEEVLNTLNTMDYFKVISRLMFGYVIAMGVFYLYAFIVYNFKYSKAKKGLVEYNSNLKKLIKLYEHEESREQILTGRVKVYSEIGGFDELDLEQKGEQ
ncbi:MAG: hypothetical protein K6E27_10485 [Eubacterium sp.]|nr:hypothetical protein [Eubacterium sp.]